MFGLAYCLGIASCRLYIHVGREGSWCVSSNWRTILRRRGAVTESIHEAAAWMEKRVGIGRLVHDEGEEGPRA